MLTIRGSHVHEVLETLFSQPWLITVGIIPLCLGMYLPKMPSATKILS